MYPKFKSLPNYLSIRCSLVAIDKRSKKYRTTTSSAVRLWNWLFVAKNSVYAKPKKPKIEFVTQLKFIWKILKFPSTTFFGHSLESDFVSENKVLLLGQFWTFFFSNTYNDEILESMKDFNVFVLHLDELSKTTYQQLGVISLSLGYSSFSA